MPHLSNSDRRKMDELTTGLPSKSAKIRRLAAAGYPRGDIARYLDIRYQFVYNVLSAESRAEPNPEDSPKEIVSKSVDTDAPSGWHWAIVHKGGSVVLPEAYLQAMGVSEGDQVQLVLDKGVVRVLSRAEVLRELQEDVGRYVPEGVSLVEQLLAERRAEVAKDSRT